MAFVAAATVAESTACTLAVAAIVAVVAATVVFAATEVVLAVDNESVVDRADRENVIGADRDGKYSFCQPSPEK